MIPFSDVARAAYCSRQLYYARQDEDRSVPEEARSRINLAFRYAELVDAPDVRLRRLPIRPTPAAYRRHLDRLRERDVYEHLVDPAAERTFRSGRDCHGIVHKVLRPDESEDATDPPPIPVIVSPGEPPEQGVWEPQSVRAVAAAKALAWEEAQTIPRAIVEYPTVGVVREIRLGVRRVATYRRALRAARSIDGPPARVDDNRCDGCSYRDRCGVRTRSLRSLLPG